MPSSLSSHWPGALPLLLLVVVRTAVAVPLTLSHVPSSWRRHPITLQVVSEADNGPDWARRFVSGAELSADIDLEPFRAAGGYVRVELAPAGGLYGVGCTGWGGVPPAQARIHVDRLAQSDATFFFADEYDRILIGSDYRPTELTFHLPDLEDIRYSRRVVMLTRGTRGDVQPFVVLARALAQLHGQHVTICTEAKFQVFIEAQGGRLGRGRVDFVLSGGNTAAVLSAPFIYSVLGMESAQVQGLCASLFEYTSFDSEPAMLALVARLRPDAVLYSMVVTSVATVISEALHVPAVGLFLQLHALPSRFYGPVVGLPGQATDSVSLSLVCAIRCVLMSRLVDRIRRRRGLPLHRADPYDIVLAQGAGAPIVVPMDEEAIGGRPADWPAQVVLSGFLWDPAPGVLAPDLWVFLRPDWAGLGPRLSISFSSMPVDIAALQRIVVAIAAKSATRPRLVLIGADCAAVTDHDAVRTLIRDGRVLHVETAPFAALFRQVDAAVVHGGLGTSSELLRSGIPALVTGPLLIDQRFWADRIHRLGYGPPMMPWAEFVADPAASVDALFGQYDRYAAQAASLAQRLQAEDGVERTAQAVLAAMETARPMQFVRGARPAQAPLQSWVGYGARLGAALFGSIPQLAKSAWTQVASVSMKRRAGRVELCGLNQSPKAD